jgi:molybdopterin adenylyltransferase
VVEYSLLSERDTVFSVGILTISDKGSRGERFDESGRVIRDMVSPSGGRAAKYDIVPDEKDIIADKLIQWSDEGTVDVILTTGGTGLSHRDVTPEATLSVVDRVVPGFPEAMRVKTASITPLAMLSRSTAGLRGNCLIINLPGNPRAVRECLEVILPAIPHAVQIIKGEVTEHAPSNSGKT